MFITEEKRQKRTQTRSSVCWIEF